MTVSAYVFMKNSNSYKTVDIFYLHKIIYPQIFSSITSNPAVNENARIISGRHTLSGSKDYYEVDLREILNGERKSGNMDKEMKETVLRAADYTNTEAEHYNRRVRICNGIALLLVGLLYSSRYGARIRAFKHRLMKKQG